MQVVYRIGAKCSNVIRYDSEVAYLTASHLLASAVFGEAFLLTTKNIPGREYDDLTATIPLHDRQYDVEDLHTAEHVRLHDTAIGVDLLRERHQLRRRRTHAVHWILKCKVERFAEDSNRWIKWNRFTEKGNKREMVEQ